MPLTLCPHCNRHIRLGEPECPFCNGESSTKKAIVRAAVTVAAGVALTATALGCAYGPGPTPDDTGSQDSGATE